MNLILLEAGDFVSSTRVRLRGRAHRHLRQVQRVELGDRLRVGRIDGRVGLGIVRALSADAVELEVELCDPPPEKLPVTLGVALPRPPSLRKILQAGTALGVEGFVFFHSARVEKSYWQSSGLRPDALRHQLLLGLEQARDTRLPGLRFERRFTTFLSSSLPALAAGRPVWFAHPEADEPCPRGGAGPCVLLLGPEGGFLPREVEALHGVGGRGLTLGERILRVEHAAIALLARMF